MKIIGIDAINIRGGGGITHIIELIRHLPIDNNLGIEKIFIWGTKNTLNQIPEKPFLIKLNYPILEKSFFHRTYFQIFKLSNLAKSKKCNILFIPGGSFFGAFKPFVSMSQNLLPFEYNELNRYNFIQKVKLLLLRFTQSKTFYRSSGIIFLTNYAKNTVLNTLASVDAKVTIIPHGISEIFFFKPRLQRNLTEISNERPFRVLYVSIIDVYKHQWNVIEAISILREKGHHIVLDLIGPSFPLALIQLESSIDRFDPQRKFVNYLGKVNYNEIHKFYYNADMGIFASSCENMPIILLEKMASGLPIACSNKGPMPEVLMDGGLYFDPENVEDISCTIEKLYNSNELRDKLSHKSFQLSKQFSWESTTTKTFNFLINIAS